MPAKRQKKSAQCPPLEGIRVLDFSQNLPGPYATFLLAALGAEVIKVEPPSGESSRIIPAFFAQVNQGKKSIVLDLRQQEAQVQAQKLLKHCDIVVEGFRPGVMKKFGLDSTTALRINPRVIYCSISGYGQQGPCAEFPGHDLNYQAMTGVCHMQRDETGQPHGTMLPIADLSSASTAVSGILAALYAREKDGQGRVLDIAMTDTLLSWATVWYEGLHPDHAQLSRLLESARQWLEKQTQKTPTRWQRVPQTLHGFTASKRVHGVTLRLDSWLKKQPALRMLERLRLYALPHYSIFRTSDGRYLSLGIVDEDKFWKAFCLRAGLTPLSYLPLPVRVMGAVPLQNHVRKIIASKSLQEWLVCLAGTEVPVFPVLTPREALHEPQILARPMVYEGRAGSPLPLSQPLTATAPALGEHTDEILCLLAAE